MLIKSLINNTMTRTFFPALGIFVLTACQPLPDIQGRYQQLNTESQRKPLSLQLQDGHLSAFTGCNNAMGSYQIDKGRLVVSQLASTMMACSEPQMQQEQIFSQFLQSKPAVSLDGTLLVLSNNDSEYQFALQPDLSQAVTRFIYVAPQRKTCTGVAPMQCLQIRENPTDDWQLFYGEIDGFTHEPGVAYRLRIKELTIENPPADAPAKKWFLDLVVEQHLQPSE